MAEAFHARIQKWNDDDEYTRCIRALDGVPTQYRDYRHAYALARALENYAVLGDGQYGCPRDKAREALRRAIGVLESVREEGLDRAEWQRLPVPDGRGGKGHSLCQNLGSARS